LSTRSQETLQQIRDRIEAGEALQHAVAPGAFFSWLADPLGALELEVVADGLIKIPEIIRGAIVKDIDLLLASPQRLTPAEITWWKEVRSIIK
jgi:hypothetical protein